MWAPASRVALPADPSSRLAAVQRQDRAGAPQYLGGAAGDQLAPGALNPEPNYEAHRAY